jgi:4-amino-4-deoxy-L-arabinose transferase-like glycosyltransferase
MNKKHTHSNKIMTLMVLVAATIVFFAGLGAYPLLDPDEGRYAEIPREMIESGDYITPRLNYVKYYEKPPLYYWITAGSLLLFGQNELAVRAVPAIAGCLTVLLIMGLGRRLFGGNTGPMAGWIYTTSVIPVIMARMPVIDGVFSLFLTATWATWWLGYDTGTKRKKTWYVVAWGCMGLATMTKGIAAIALTAVIIFPFIFLRRDWKALKDMAWIPGILLFAAIVLPWHIAAALRDPQFVHFYIVVQHFQRISGQEHASPFWFFPAILPFGLLCWTALLFPASVKAFKLAFSAIKIFPSVRKRKRNEDVAPGGSKNPKTEIESSKILFLLIWALAVPGLFSLSTCKLVPYILPAYPAMALLLSYYLSRGGLKNRSTRWCNAIMAGLLLVAIPVVFHFSRIQDTMPAEAVRGPLHAALWGLGSGSVLLILAIFKRRFIPLATGLVLVALLPSAILSVPAVANHRKTGGFIKAMSAPLPPEVNIAEWSNYDQSLSFYTNRRIILIDEIDELAFGKSLEAPSGFFLKGAKSLKRLANEGPFLVNLRPEAWPRVKKWGILHPVAVNSTNVMVGNDDFFRITGLVPWPDDSSIERPLLLLPRISDTQNR